MEGQIDEQSRSSSSSSLSSYTNTQNTPFSLRGFLSTTTSRSSRDQKKLLRSLTSDDFSVRAEQIESTSPPTTPGPPVKRRWLRRNLVRLLAAGAATIGLLFLTSNIILLLSRSIVDYANDPNSIFAAWGHQGTGTESLSWYPTDFLRDVIPIPAHSHNDYWRTVPLFSAIHVGCTGVEADIWHFDDDDTLYVGHDLSSLTKNRTFSSLYVEPLVDLLNTMNPKTEFTAAGSETRPNGIFDTDKEKPLVLLVDIKTDGAKTWPYLVKQLEPLRERGWLSYVDADGTVVERPVTVVGTGNTVFEDVLGTVDGGGRRDLFFDAPLGEMHEDEGHDPTGGHDVYNITNSFYASASMGKVLGPVWYATGGMSGRQRERMRGQIKGAHRRGLKVRYWSLPAWPRGFRNEIWRVLIEEGVDFLNVDDVKGVQMFDLF